VRFLFLFLILLPSFAYPALTEAAMASAIKSACITAMSSVIVTPTPTNPNPNQLTNWCTALGTAVATGVVAQIQSNATVLPGTFSNSGGAVSGTGTVQ
jgi:hypothetical protein